MVTGITLFAFVFPWVGVSSLVFLARGFQGRYREGELAQRHAKIGAIGPAIGTLLVILDLGALGGGMSDRVHASDLAITLGILLAAFGLTSLPLWFHRLRVRA